MTIMVWLEFKKGDNVVVNDKGEGTYRGRTGICLDDSTETPFGHKHVEVTFDDDGETVKLRTIHFDLTKKAKPDANGFNSFEHFNVQQYLWSVGLAP